MNSKTLETFAGADRIAIVTRLERKAAARNLNRLESGGWVSRARKGSGHGYALRVLKATIPQELRDKLSRTTGAPLRDKLSELRDISSTTAVHFGPELRDKLHPYPESYPGSIPDKSRARARANPSGSRGAVRQLSSSERLAAARALVRGDPATTDEQLAALYKLNACEIAEVRSA